MKSYEIAVLPGGGIGREVMRATETVLDAVGAAHRIQLRVHHFDWSCETYKARDRMMQEEDLDRLRDYDAIPQHCQPHRPGLVGGDDARAPG
jgi:tartrate dehydrogenase/decarboxylase/D-malate dehydrogenase